MDFLLLSQSPSFINLLLSITRKPTRLSPFCDLYMRIPLHKLAGATQHRTSFGFFLATVDVSLRGRRRSTYPGSARWERAWDSRLETIVMPLCMCVCASTEGEEKRTPTDRGPEGQRKEREDDSWTAETRQKESCAILF